MSSEKFDKKRAETGSANGESILEGLESLLAEEGLSLEGEIDEDALDQLLDEEDDLDAAIEEDSAPQNRARSTQRSTRAERRNRDRADFNNLDTQMQVAPLGVVVSEDQLTATLSHVTEDHDYEAVIDLIRSRGISHGIDYVAIRSAINSARRGIPCRDLVIARGHPPQTIKEASVAYRLPVEVMQKKKTSDKMTDFELLKHILEGQHIEAIRSYRGVVRPVKPGDAIAEIIPAEIEPGVTVFGTPFDIDQDDEVYLQIGDNTDLSEDGLTCFASIYGYAGLLDGDPTVLPPIWISPDRMDAYFVFIAPAEGYAQPAPSTEDLHYLLEMMWVSNGIMNKQVRLIQQRLERAHPLPTLLPIAQGHHEVPGDNAQIHYTFDPYSILSWNQIEAVQSMQSPEEVCEALDAIYSDPAAPTFTAMGAGHTLIEKTPATEGVTGVDIQGEEVVPKPGDDVPIEFGHFLSLDENGLRCRAQVFGYVCLQWDIQVRLLPPLWITPDKTRAYFLNLPQGSSARYPRQDEIEDLLQLHDITYGFDPERWVHVLRELKAGKQSDYLILIAEGEPAQTGTDAYFEWAVDVREEKKIGKVLEDGSIDFRERDLITLVQEKDLLGRLIPPQPGTAGIDIFGNALHPPPHVNIEVVIDTHIYAEPEGDGTIGFFASAGGGISVLSKEKEANGRRSRRIDISINSISSIDGDVDYTTGNIEFNGDVVIDGSVQQQFSVRATGSVTIGGYVESGAYITAGKNIVVKRGVIGDTTELIAGASVITKYIQESTVRAGGDVRVGSYIFNASVRAGGQVVISGKGEGKSRALVGGLVWGGRGILAKSIGSPYNTNTKLVAGINPDSVERIDKIRANLITCGEKQEALLTRIGLSSMDIAQVKKKLSFCRTAKEKQKVLQIVKRIAHVAELEDNLQRELEDIADRQRRTALRTFISIHGKLFAGVELRIGELTHLISDDLQNISFGIVQNEEEQSIQVGPFRSSSR